MSAIEKIPVDENTRQLLLNYTSPPDPVDTAWAVGIRAKVEPLLLEHGKLPYKRLMLSEEGIRQALQSNPVSRIPVFSQLKRAIQRREATRAQRLVDFLTETPLREISAPFEDQTLIIMSWRLSLEREIMLRRETLGSEKPLPIPQCSISETLLVFTSTAWWLNKDSGRGFLLCPGSIIDQKEEIPSILHGNFDHRNRQQVEAIVEYVNNYYNSNSNTRRVK